MAAAVESMFSVREKPWHGLGTIVMEAPNSGRALKLAGLDWKVIQKNIYTVSGEEILGYKANIRDKDNQILGVVTDRYKVVQNEEAFAFTDSLLGQGVRYETAGSLQEGRKVWILAKLPKEYLITGDRVSPYLVFTNSHDGMGAIRVAVTPIRVVCQNTLNLALSEASRNWSTVHIGNVRWKMEEAEKTLFLADKYMNALSRDIENLQKVKLSDKKVMDYMNRLLPIPENASDQMRRNICVQRNDLKARYFEAPDLQQVGKNAYRFINAVSDFGTHAEALRRTRNYQENLFERTIKGNKLIDTAYAMIKEAA